jgi:hypothetical protein
VSGLAVVGFIALAFLAKPTEISWFVLHKLLLQELRASASTLSTTFESGAPSTFGV